MKMNKKEIGAAGELLAEEMLVRHGYRILCRNYRCPYGEIDLIACDREKIAFIEVKTRLSKAFGDGKEAVNLQKQNRIKRAAGYFLSHTRAFYKETDFQVVEIQLTHMTNLIF